MIHDIHDNGGRGPRTLAVVSGHAERAGEVRDQFAVQGEVVETRWYASPQDLLAQAGEASFAAVILFDENDAGVAQSNEAELRGRLSHTPLFHVAA